MQIYPVLATCHIQPLNEAFENTFPRLPVLATWDIRVRRFGTCEIALEG